MEQLDGIWQKLTKNQKIGLVIGAVVITVVVIIVVAILNIKANVNLKFATKTNIPETELVKVKERLLDVIRTNSSNFDEKATYDGTVREYSENKDGKTTIASFFVDFDKIRQSYTVEVTWPDPNLDSPNIIISCPLADSKFPDTPCLTEVNSSSEIVSYLPYTGTLDSGKEYTVEADYDASILYLKIKIDVCAKSKDATSALESVKEWVSSLNRDANEFTYYLETKNCKNDPQYVQVNHAKTNDANVNENLPYFVPNMYKAYPVVDDNGDVTSIKIELAGCTDYQTDPAEQEIKGYLKSKNIKYPIEIEYCVN